MNRCYAHGAAAVPTPRRRLTYTHAPLPRPRRCGGPDTALRHTCYGAAPTPRLHASPRSLSL
eukprot:scaffold109812_cov74-Phaeocystis_antarctica.AAC.3